MPRKHGRTGRDLSAELSNQQNPQEQEPNILLSATNKAFDLAEKISNVDLPKTIESINKTAQTIDNTIDNAGKFITENIEFYNDVKGKINTAVFGATDKVQETAENDKINVERNVETTKPALAGGKNETTNNQFNQADKQNIPNPNHKKRKRQRFNRRQSRRELEQAEQTEQKQENNFDIAETSEKISYDTEISDLPVRQTGKIQENNKNTKITPVGKIGEHGENNNSKRKSNRHNRRQSRREMEKMQQNQESNVHTVLCEELELPLDVSDKIIVDELAKRAEYGIKLPEIVQNKLDNIKAIADDLLISDKFDQHSESSVSRKRKISVSSKTSDFQEFFHQNPTNAQIIKSRFFSLRNLDDNYIAISKSAELLADNYFPTNNFEKASTDSSANNRENNASERIRQSEDIEDISFDKINDKIIPTTITFEKNNRLIRANKQLEKISNNKLVGFAAGQAGKISKVKNTIDDGTGLTLKTSISYTLQDETAKKVSTKFEKIDSKLDKKAERLIKQVESDNQKFAKDLKHAKFTQAKTVAGHVMQSDTRQETVANDVSMDISDLAMHRTKENIKAVSDTLEKALLKATAPTKTDVQNKINQKSYSQKKKVTEKAVKKEHQQDRKETKADPSARAENRHKRKENRAESRKKTISNNDKSTTSPQAGAIDFSKPLSKKDLAPTKSDPWTGKKVLSTKGNRKISFERYKTTNEISGDNGLSRKVSFEKYENSNITIDKSTEKIFNKPKEKTKEFAYGSSRGKAAIHKAINLKNFNLKKAAQAKAKATAKKLAIRFIRRVAIIVAKLFVVVMSLVLKILLILLGLLLVLLPIIIAILLIVTLITTILAWFDFNTPDVPTGSSSAVVDYFRSLEDYLYFGDPTVFADGITPPNLLFTVDNDALLTIYENNLGTTLHEINFLRVDPQGHDSLLLIMFLTAKYGNFSDTHDYIVLVNEFFFRNSPSFPFLGSTFGQYEMITELRTESRIDNEGNPFTAHILDVTLINHFWDNEEAFIENLKENLTEEQRARFESLLENGFMGGFLVASPFEADWRPFVTSSMGLRNLSNTGTQYHNGIDIAGGPAVGGAPILAGLDGIVLSSSVRSGYGETIIIHDPIRDVSALYAHMVAGSRQVSEGDTVYVGQHIGNVGNTGITFGATGIHLHIEIWENTGGRLVFQDAARPYLRDPEIFLQPGVGAVIEDQIYQFSRLFNQIFQ